MYGLLQSRLLTDNTPGITVVNDINDDIRELVESGKSLQLFPVVSCKVTVREEIGIPHFLYKCPSMGRPRKPVPQPETSRPDMFGKVYDSPYVEVMFSGGMGLGVFAKVDIPPNTYATEYYGTHIVPMPLPRHHTTHTLSLTRDMSVIQGIQFPISFCGVGSLINSSPKPNCRFVKFPEQGRAYIQTCRQIRAGEELFAGYRFEERPEDVVPADEEDTISVSNEDTISYDHLDV